MNVKEHFRRNWQTYLVVGLLLLVLLVLIGNSFTSRSTNFASETNTRFSKSYPINPAVSYEGSYYNGEIGEKKITQANIELETENYFGSKNSIINSIKAKKGVILDEGEYKDKDNKKSLYLSAKVPSEELDALLEELKTFADVKSLSINTQDVTKNYGDYSDRLSRYEEQIKKYKDMLKRNISIEDEIKIQNRIDQLEDQTFYLEKRMSEIDDEVNYSKVYITLREKQSILESVDFLGFKESAKLFLNSLNTAFRLVIILIGFLLPFGVIYLIYKLIKRFFKK